MENTNVIIDENRKNNFLSLKDKAEILKRLEQGAIASCLAREYGVSKSTVSRFKKRKESIQQAVTTIYPNNTERRTMRGTFHPKMEQALYKWYVQKTNQNIIISTTMLREQAHIFYNEFQESNYSFSASTGWIKNFKKRFGIKRLAGEKSNESQNYKSLRADEVLYEDVEYLHETEPEYEPHPVIATQHEEIPKATHCSFPEKLVRDTEAYQCLETVIRWSIQKKIDTLYLTMLKNLKCRARKGKS